MDLFTWFEEDRETKINGLEGKIIILVNQQEVLRLQISMHNPKRMASLNNPNNNPGQLSGPPLTVVSPLDNAVEELAAGAKLHNNMDIERILISTFDGDNVLVTSQMVHYLNLPPNILNILSGDQLPLRDRLAGVLGPRRVLDAQIGCPELPLS